MVVQKRIADYIEKEHKKTTAIADCAGIRRDRFSMIIHCKTELKADELERICSALGTSPIEFVWPELKKE